MKVMDLLLREVRDPRVAGIHVTRVEMTGDLSQARLFYRPTPGEATAEEAAQALSRVAGFLRHEIGRSLGLKRVPELLFDLDELPDRGARVEELLREVQGDAPSTDDDPVGES